MRQVRLMSTVCFLLLFTTGCGSQALRLMGGGSSSAVQGMSASADGTSFASRCGAKATDMTDPDHIVVDQHMAGLTMETSGSSGGIAFTVTLVPSLHLRAAGGSSVSESIVTVQNVVAEDDGRFSKAKAEEQARENSNRRTSISMSNGLLMDLQQSDASFKGIECAIGFTGMTKVETVLGAGRIQFTPGLPESLNPLPPASTYDTELGTSKTFTTKAKILEAATDWAPKGTVADVVITITKVSADLPTTAGVPTGAPAIDADVAYEFAFSSPGRDLSTLGISKRRVMFVNTKTHELKAIVEEQGKIDATTKKAVPVAVVIKSSSTP